MAHRTDVFQVHQRFPTKDSSETVVDPNCGKEIIHREAKSVLFREGEALYFCSKECREKYIASQYSSRAA
jgi:YHS domain-containing protein